MRTALIIVGLMAAAFSCSIEPEYEPYEGPSDVNGGNDSTDTDTSTGTDTDTGTQDNCALAFAGVDSAISSSCGSGSCHGTGGAGAGVLTLNPDDTANNRSALEAFTGGNPEKLEEKIGPDGAHTGGDQSSVLGSATIEAWHSACF